MPTKTADTLEKIAFHLFRAAGAPDEHSRVVANHLVDANLTGHDSHGFIRIQRYLNEIKKGMVNPKAIPEVVNDNPAFAQIDGHKAFGQVVAKFAIEIAIEKARECGVSLVTMSNAGHIGRVGAYPELAAQQGMAAIMCFGHIRMEDAKSSSNVAPFGGREGRLATNPISIAFPRGEGAPVLLDFATSIVAAGKIFLYEARKQSLPDKWLLNKEGVPSDDPSDYHEGALLPLGGLSAGHKGFALSVAVALLGGALSGFVLRDRLGKIPPSGTSIIVIDIQKLAPLEEFKAYVDSFVGYLKRTPPMHGFSEILYPGEVEHRNRLNRREHGIDVEESTWNQALEYIREYGLERDLASLI